MARSTNNMGLIKWDSLQDNFNHVALAANWDAVDGHDHSQGKGVRIPAAGIANSAVTSSKIASQAVIEDKIGPGAVSESKLLDGAVTHTKIGRDAVDASNIIDQTVGTAELAPKSVTSDKTNLTAGGPWGGVINAGVPLNGSIYPVWPAPGTGPNIWYDIYGTVGSKVLHMVKANWAVQGVLQNGFYSINADLHLDVQNSAGAFSSIAYENQGVSVAANPTFYIVSNTILHIRRMTATKETYRLSIGGTAGTTIAPTGATSAGQWTVQNIVFG